MTERDILAIRTAIENITQILAGKGIKVTQRGARAYVESTPKGEPVRVNLPYIPDNASDELVAAIHGFLDHEVGHLLFSNFDVIYEANTRGKKFANLHNLIEDTWIERAMAKKFKGSADNLDNVGEFFIKKYIAPNYAEALANEDMKDAVNQLVMPMFRAMAGHVPFAKYMEDKWDLVEPVKQKMGEDLLKELPNISSSQQALELAERIVENMRDDSEGCSGDDEGEGGGSSEDDDEESDDFGDSTSESTSSEDDDPEASEKDDAKSKPDGEDEESSSKEEDEFGEDDSEGGEDDKPEESPGEEEGESGADDEPEEKDDPKDEDESGGEGSDKDEGESGSDDADEDEDSGKGKGAGEDEDESEDEGAGEDEDESEDEGAGEDESEDEDESGEGAGADDDEPEDEDESGEGAGADDDEPDGDGSDSGSDDEDESEGDSDGGEPDDEEDEDSGESDGGEEDEADEPGRDWEDGIPPEMENALNADDFDDSMAKLLTDDATESASDADYLPFTKDFDTVEQFTFRNWQDSYLTEIDDETAAMVGPLQKNLERLILAQSVSRWQPGLRSGRINTSALHRLRTGDTRVFRKREVSESKDVAVSLVVDCSGSMAGREIRLAMVAAYALSTVLDRIGINHEVSGFTTKGYGRVPIEMKEEMSEETKRLGREFSRYEPLYLPIFKGYSERLSVEQRKRIAAAPHQGFLANNVDGESIEYAAQRLLAQRQTGKVMFVLSDGSPAAYGDHWAQDRHLKNVVKRLSDGGVKMLGIGIGTDCVKDYYPKYAVLDNVDELPGKVMGELKAALLN